MKVYTSQEAAQVVCPNVARSCAGERCAAWSEIGDKGFCGVVAPVAPITHYSTSVPASEVAAFADAAVNESNEIHPMHGNRKGRHAR